jgi:serine/threonine-protein kinase
MSLLDWREKQAPLDVLAPLRSVLKDRYVLEREIGRGSMATVYLAHDVRHGRRVALKVLRWEMRAIVTAERFRREIQIAATLVHPHIVPILD